MLPTQRRDPRVVNLCPGDASIAQQTAQGRPVRRGLGQKRERWRFDPGINLVEGPGRRRRRCVDAWMSDDREKLVQAWPRNASDSRPLGQLRDASKSCLMERGIFAMRIDENIRIERRRSG